MYHIFAAGVEGVCTNGAAALIALILVLILAGCVTAYLRCIFRLSDKNSLTN